MTQTAQISIARQSGYQFLVDFAPGLPQLVADEPPPLGLGQGPSPAQMLMAAVANCLCASLTFALQKFKHDPGKLVATVEAHIDRNDANRLRIQSFKVDIQMGAKGADLVHLDRALAQFEEFCTVSMSVREGIPMTVSVSDGTGVRLK